MNSKTEPYPYEGSLLKMASKGSLDAFFGIRPWLKTPHRTALSELFRLWPGFVVAHFVRGFSK
jgi:hypothetical protein